MSPEELVRKRFADAAACYVKPVYETGQINPVQTGHWGIRAETALGAPILGTGATEQEAWENAAKRLPELVKIDRARRWKEYLLEKGFKKGESELDCLVHPADADLTATFDLKTGRFHPSTKLMKFIVGASDSFGNPISATDPTTHPLGAISNTLSAITCNWKRDKLLRGGMRLVVSYGLVLMISSFAYANDWPPESIQTVYKHWLDRQNRVKTFEFEWDERVAIVKGGFSDYSLQRADSAAHPMPPEDTIYLTKLRLLMENGKIRAEGQKLEASQKKAGLQRFTMILTKDLSKVYEPKEITDRPLGSITKGRLYDQAQNTQLYPELTPLAMVFRPFRYAGFAFDNFTERYVVVPGFYTVDDHKCIVIKEKNIQPGRPFIMLWLDPQRDFIPLRYVRQIDDIPTFQYDYIGWVKEGSDWIPTEWRRSQTNASSQTINRSAHATVKKHLVNKSVEPKEFTLEFPPLTYVNDTKHNEKYIQLENGKKRPVLKEELQRGATYEELLRTEPVAPAGSSDRRNLTKGYDPASIRYLSDMKAFDVHVAEGRFAQHGDLGYSAGNPESSRILVNGTESPNGISMCPVQKAHASAKFTLPQGATRFQSWVAFNDSAGTSGAPPGVGKINYPITFEVLGDGNLARLGAVRTPVVDFNPGPEPGQ